MQVLMLLNNSHGQEIPYFFKFGSSSVKLLPIGASLPSDMDLVSLTAIQVVEECCYFSCSFFFFGLNLPCFNHFSQNCLLPNKTQYYMCGLTSTVYSSVSQS